MALVKRSGFIGSGATSLAPTAAVSTDTSFTVSFPNNISVIPKRIRASGSVSGQIKLNYGAGQQIVISVNPNAPEMFAMIPSGTYKSPVSELSLLYQASGAGSIYVTVDY
jgi:hypothetical protein